jgi:hypothetical protein
MVRVKHRKFKEKYKIGPKNYKNYKNYIKIYSVNIVTIHKQKYNNLSEPRVCII